MKTEIKISEEYKEPMAIIYSDKLTEEVTAAAAYLSADERHLTGIKDDRAVILDNEKIIRIYSASQKVYAVTYDGEYLLKMRLYEAEARLDGRQFVRISSSELINLKATVCFDLSLNGTVMVKMKNGDKCYASRRFVGKIRSILGL